MILCIYYCNCFIGPISCIDPDNSSIYRIKRILNLDVSFHNSSPFLRAATFGAHVMCSTTIRMDQWFGHSRWFPENSFEIPCDVKLKVHQLWTFSRLPVQQMGRKHMCSFWRMWSQTSLNFIAIVSYLLY